MHQCISMLKFKEGCADELISAAIKLAKLGQSEKGNVYYNVLRAKDEPDILFINEKWESIDDFLSHVANADKPGDPVFEFGVLVNRCAADSKIFNCDVLA